MAKNGIGRPSKGTKVHTHSIPDVAKVILRGKKVKLIKKIRKEKLKTIRDKYDFEEWYSPSSLCCYEGYDICENLYFAKKFIRRKHKISEPMFMALLFMYPKKFFTYYDYKPIAHMEYAFNSPSSLIKHGMVRVVAYNKNLKKPLRNPSTVFTLSDKARKIVEEFYAVLSGEKPFDETVFEPNVQIRDKYMVGALKKLNALPVSDSKKKLFEP